MNKERLMEARNELSDIINTWGGVGVDGVDEKLCQKLEQILDLFDAELLPPAVERTSGL